MVNKYLEAGHQYDPRSPTDNRAQPWRAWWPLENLDQSQDQEQINGSAQEDSIRELEKWCFDFKISEPFEKPWLLWPLQHPSTYNKAAPKPILDTQFIQDRVASLPPDAVSVYQPNRISAFVQFFGPDPTHASEKPYASKIPPPRNDQKQINFGGVWDQIMITDVRGHEELFSLDKDGFEFASHASECVKSGATLDVQQYLREMTDWLRSRLGCKEVFIWDYTHRSEAKAISKGIVDISRRVHCDQSPRSAIGRIKLHMGERATKLLEGRCRIINLWRPLNPVIERYPLAMCSFTTVSPQDLVPVDVILPHFAEEAFEIRKSDAHRWYYRSKMTNEELIMLKIWDNTLADGHAFCAPHSSFEDVTASADAKPRSSIEIRCMVFD